MKHSVLFLLLFFGVGAAACTLDDAAQKAAAYADRGEAVDIQPQAKTLLGVDEYWVMELVALGKIVVMLPVKAPDCVLDTDAAVLPALKTHYLANYFATDDTLPDYLQNELQYAQSKKSVFQNALNQLAAQEPKIPQNASLPTLSSFKTSLSESISADDALRAQILKAQPLLAAVARPSDVDTVSAELASVFSLQDSFLKSVETASSSANAFVAEVNNDPEMAKNPGLAQALIQIALSVTADVTAKRDTLIQNQNTVTSFFAALDSKAADYIDKLVARVANTQAEQERRSVWSQLLNYSTAVNNITAGLDTLPPADQGTAQQLVSLLNQSQAYYSDGKYADAKALFSEIESLSAQLLPKLGTWPPQCAAGKVWDATANACVCPAGTVEEVGKCVTKPTGIPTSYYVTGGIIILIVVVAAYGLRRRKPAPPPEESWTQYWKR